MRERITKVELVASARGGKWHRTTQAQARGGREAAVAKRFGWQTMDANNAERAGAKGAIARKLEAKGFGLNEVAACMLYEMRACPYHPEEKGRVIEQREKGEHLRLLARAEPQCGCYAVEWKGR